MEHGGKMEHRVFWKKYARRGSIFKSTWFLSSASSASCIEIKLAIDYVFGISQKRNFTLLINQFTRVVTSSALTCFDLLHQVLWIWLCTCCSHFYIIWLSNGWYYNWHNGFSPNVNSGAKWNMVCWGKMALCGKMSWGKTSPCHRIPKGVSFCPNVLVRFTPRPFHPRKFQWRKWLNGSRKRELTHCGRVANTNLWRESSLV